ncbi:hypothetical protein NDU88_006762 [Pleurodeles waltl]|uniref:Uncharacterized protein n=1 Tax=Pleurodeles waltl TaxID=8319 RepID=A0AAV7SQL1_PLEWA|nr:hypothetical protein NDU88_006762 [Pleurodeles waltl]
MQPTAFCQCGLERAPNKVSRCTLRPQRGPPGQRTACRSSLPGGAGSAPERCHHNCGPGSARPCPPLWAQQSLTTPRSDPVAARHTSLIGAPPCTLSSCDSSKDLRLHTQGPPKGCHRAAPSPDLLRGRDGGTGEGKQGPWVTLVGPQRLPTGRDQPSQSAAISPSQTSHLFHGAPPGPCPLAITASSGATTAVHHRGLGFLIATVQPNQPSTINDFSSLHLNGVPLPSLPLLFQPTGPRPPRCPPRGPWVLRLLLDFPGSSAGPQSRPNWA